VLDDRGPQTAAANRQLANEPLAHPPVDADGVCRAARVRLQPDLQQLLVGAALVCSVANRSTSGPSTSVAAVPCPSINGYLRILKVEVPVMETETWEGWQLTAARALAGLTVRELAERASTNKATVNQLETRAVIMVADGKRRGHVRKEVWDRIVGALDAAGVELLPENGSHGAGLRWRSPRAQRDRSYAQTNDRPCGKGGSGTS
jgi:hypothetical protein